MKSRRWFLGMLAAAPAAPALAQVLPKEKLYGDGLSVITAELGPLVAGTIRAEQLQANCIMISDLNAARITSKCGTMVIAPGKIIISDDTKLEDWRTAL